MRDTSLPVASVVLAMLLAGCGQTGSSTATIPAATLQQSAAQRGAAIRPGWLSDEARAGKGLLYVADQFGQTVYIFPQKGHNPAPIGAITQGIAGPDGISVDPHGTLYVCNFGAGTVTVYPKGTMAPSKTLTGAGVAPIDVVAGNDGTVYVADFNEGTSGHVFEYAHGSTSPTTTIDLTGYPEGVALDHGNNLYVAYQKTANAATVLKYAPGSTQATDLNLPIVLVGGATVDEHDDLLVVDQSGPSPHVDVFPPGASSPSEIIGGFPLAFDIALNRKHRHLYVTQVQNPAVVYEVSYPQGTMLEQITNTIRSAFGVATSPDGSP
jgi:hypothetical protein